MRFLGTRYPPDPSVVKDHDTTATGPGESVIPWDLYPPLAHHSMNGQVPAVLHFNGGSKELMEQWWGKLWWTSDRERFKGIVQERMRAGRVRIAVPGGYRTEKVQDLCPNLDVWKWETHVAT